MNDEITRIITDANLPSNHRINLSEMLIAWLRANPDSTVEHEQDMYLTFSALNTALKKME